MDTEQRKELEEKFRRISEELDSPEKQAEIEAAIFKELREARQRERRAQAGTHCICPRHTIIRTGAHS